MTWGLSPKTWEWVGYLGWCFSIYAAYLFVSTIFGGSRPKHAESWMKFVQRLSKWRDRLKEKGRAHQVAIANLIALLCLVIIVGGSWGKAFPVVEEHNVTILARLGDGDFAYRSDEEPGGGEFRPCTTDVEAGVDVLNLLKGAVGYTAEHARWEERGTCKSIRRADLGFWFRDEATNFEYRRAQ